VVGIQLGGRHAPDIEVAAGAPAKDHTARMLNSSHDNEFEIWLQLTSRQAAWARAEMEASEEQKILISISWFRLMASADGGRPRKLSLIYLVISSRAELD
jgi:hypothetical protein